MSGDLYVLIYFKDISKSVIYVYLKICIVCLSQNKIEALGDDNYEAEINFDNNNEFSVKMQLDLLIQALKTINKPILKFLVKDGMGLMTFAQNEEEKEISLVLCVK